MYRILAFIITVLVMVGCGSTIHPRAHIPPPAVRQAIVSSPQPAVEIQRVTGADLEPCWRWRVCGTDLAIPFKRVDGSTAFLFGDTFAITDPARQIGTDGWRSPVMLFSNIIPGSKKPFAFTGAANVSHFGAEAFMDNRWQTGMEHTVIPTDGISFTETGDTIVSYMSVRSWYDTGIAGWQTNNAGLAWSRDGRYFERIGPIWQNNADNTDPFQMWSMQRDGDWVYIVSTRAGRQEGPMMLMRVPWDRMLERDAYECLGDSGIGNQCVPMSYGTGRHERPLEGRFGEPSLRKLTDTTGHNIWVLSYLERYTNPYSGTVSWQIVTRTTSAIGKPWSRPKVQITEREFPRLYGGSLHPDSTPDNLIFMVSTWRDKSPEFDQRYDVTIFQGSV